MVSSQNLNSFKLLCMSLLPARMKMIEYKMKELGCSQNFPHYKSMGIFPDAQWQLTHPAGDVLWVFVEPGNVVP